MIGKLSQFEKGGALWTIGFSLCLATRTLVSIGNTLNSYQKNFSLTRVKIQHHGSVLDTTSSNGSCPQCCVPKTNPSFFIGIYRSRQRVLVGEMARAWLIQARCDLLLRRFCFCKWASKVVLQDFCHKVWEIEIQQELYFFTMRFVCPNPFCLIDNIPPHEQTFSLSQERQTLRLRFFNNISSIYVKNNLSTTGSHICW